MRELPLVPIGVVEVVPVGGMKKMENLGGEQASIAAGMVTDEADRFAPPVSVHLGDGQVFPVAQAGQPAIEGVLDIGGLSIIPGQIINEKRINGRRSPGKGVVSLVKDCSRIHGHDAGPADQPFVAVEEKKERQDYGQREAEDRGQPSGPRPGSADEEKDGNKKKNGKDVGPGEKSQAGEPAAQEVTWPIVPEREIEKPEEEKEAQCLRLEGLGHDAEGGVQDEGRGADRGDGRADIFFEDKKKEKGRERRPDELGQLQEQDGLLQGLLDEDVEEKIEGTEISESFSRQRPFDRLAGGQDILVKLGWGKERENQEAVKAKCTDEKEERQLSCESGSFFHRVGQLGRDDEPSPQLPFL